MEKAKIVVIEDHSNFRDIIRRVLAGTSHHIVEEAVDRESGLDVARRLRAATIAGETLANVILLDGNLSDDGPRDGRDARDIVGTLSIYRSHFTIINISLSTPQELGIRFDADVGKDGINRQLLPALEAI